MHQKIKPFNTLNFLKCKKIFTKSNSLSKVFTFFTKKLNLMLSDISNIPLCQIFFFTNKLWQTLSYVGKKVWFALMLVYHGSCHKLSMFTALCSDRASSGVYPEHSLILTLIHIYIYNTYVYIYLKNIYVYKYHCVDVCKSCIKKIKTFH